MIFREVIIQGRRIFGRGLFSKNNFQGCDCLGKIFFLDVCSAWIIFRDVIRAGPGWQSAPVITCVLCWNIHGWENSLTHLPKYNHWQIFCWSPNYSIVIIAITTIYVFSSALYLSASHDDFDNCPIESVDVAPEQWLIINESLYGDLSKFPFLIDFNQHEKCDMVLLVKILNQTSILIRMILLWNFHHLTFYRTLCQTYSIFNLAIVQLPCYL